MDDDDVLIREHSPFYEKSFRGGGFNHGEKTNNQDESSSKVSVVAPSPSANTRRDRSSSSKRLRESARGYGGLAKVEAADSSGGDNAFSALATMLKSQVDGEESPRRSKSSLPGADTQGGSPSSLSSTSASLDGGRDIDSALPVSQSEPKPSAKAADTESEIPCLDLDAISSLDSRKNSPSQPRNTKHSQTFESKADRPRKRKKKASVSHNFQSIVGSRPKHWDRPTSIAPAQHRSGISQANSHQRQDSLAAAVTGSFRRPRSEHLPIQQTPTPKRSLIPSFLPKPTATTTRDVIQEPTEGSPSNRFTSPKPLTAQGGLSPLGSPPERKTHQKKGPVAKRLQSLRDEARGDLVRLQSGQYPFSLKSSDRNDPRNRATTICDMTILGSPIGTGKLSTALCYIHNWEIPQSSVDSSDPHGLAWVAFTVDTTRHNNLVPGSELRIYNAVAVAVEGNIPFMVFCTQLSEPYPSQHLNELSKTCLRVNTNVSVTKPS